MNGKNSETQIGDPELNRIVKQLCESKADEFRLLGYEEVKAEEVWECVSDKYHKSGTPSLHQIVSDILSLRVTQFMNFITLRIYRGEFR